MTTAAEFDPLPSPSGASPKADPVGASPQEGQALCAPRADRWRRVLQRLAFWCVILSLAVAAVVAGLVLRRYAWDQTEPIRFVGDIDNAFVQGTSTLRVGFLDRYDEMYNSHEDDGNFQLDYAPARLLIATCWTKWVRTQVDGPHQDWRLAAQWPSGFYAKARSLHRQYDLCRPLLNLNAFGEILSALGIFFLVRFWTSENLRKGKRSTFNAQLPTSSETLSLLGRWTLEVERWAFAPSRPIILGLIAALFFWFNPALIWNAHCWPQWDSWLLPFFLWALVAASADWWFCAGLLVATGAMFKGQILFVAPLFIFWPLFRGQWRAVVRWVIGFTTAVAAITAVWLVRTDQHVNDAAIAWVIGMAAAAALLWPLLRLTWAWYAKLPVAVLVIGLIIWPFVPFGWEWIAGAIVGLLAMAALVRFLPRRALAYAGSAWVASALLLCAPLFNGSTAWFQIGFAYGTRHYLIMGSGPNNNLPELLSQRWQWRDPMSTAYTMSPGKDADRLGAILTAVDRRIDHQPGQPLNIPLKYVLFGIYAVTLLLCSAGAAIQSRRGSPRFLVAVAAPWIVFFVVMTQMHQRYLLWGATISAGVVALGPGWALLHLLVTAIAWSQEMQTMLGAYRHTDNGIYRFIEGWHPGVGWALLLTAIIFVYFTLKPERKPRASS
jgi:hypothetical protein